MEASLYEELEGSLSIMWGAFWKEWHSGIWEMVGRGVDIFLVLPGYPHIEEVKASNKSSECNMGETMSLTSAL